MRKGRAFGGTARNRCGLPGAVIDESMNVLHLRGPTGVFLATASRAARLNLGQMLKQGLGAKVKSAIIQARKENCAVRREGLRVMGNPRRRINAEVTPLLRRAAGQRRFLVVFESVDQRPARRGGGAVRRVAALEHEHERLRHELAESRQSLRSAIEDQPAAHEELRCAVEEIQCSNEELRAREKSSKQRGRSCSPRTKG